MGHITGYTRCTAILFRVLTPWSRIVLEKLTVTQLVKKFPAFCGAQRFIAAFRKAYHWTKLKIPDGNSKT
jgi:hypothetical protein